ncbi:hypothetical protein [Nocardioides sp. GXQ0305]|uniref:hypothetical protein n=1 Tax=Nocardioides sp. GXQ0305 TaxID=3423912 RepID=UPI003D7E88C7
MHELDVYLQQHWAAAAGGLDLARRVAASHAGSDVGADLATVAEEIADDRVALRELMLRLDLDPGTVVPAVVRLAERIGRLKPNGRLLRRSPVSDVLELEAMRAGVSGKRAGWDALLALAEDVEALPGDELQRLRTRADDQLERLAAVHAALVVRSLAPTT